MSDYQLFQVSVNISVTGKSELCFPCQACIDMPNKWATHASLMGQREVPLLGDYEAAWHLGEGWDSPTLQPLQDERMNGLGYHPGWITRHLQPLWLCSTNSLHRKSRCWDPSWFPRQGCQQYKRYQLLCPNFHSSESGNSLHQENSVGWYKVVTLQILQNNWLIDHDLWERLRERARIAKKIQIF